jgi:hypothetical protein
VKIDLMEELNVVKNQNDETLSIINKSKHLEKGGYKEQNGRTQFQEDHLKG